MCFEWNYRNWFKVDKEEYSRSNCNRVDIYEHVWENEWRSTWKGLKKIQKCKEKIQAISIDNSLTSKISYWQITSFLCKSNGNCWAFVYKRIHQLSKNWNQFFPQNHESQRSCRQAQTKWWVSELCLKTYWWQPVPES